MKPDLSVNVAGIAMRNPIMTASGTFGYGEEFAPYIKSKILWESLTPTGKETCRGR